ncbi:hypothetical protein JW926_12660, partial [Candidatus Sumerlaeota bacterium]|nr:hypothetical protein [Candidatus Sumerlaeota bacterium]
DLDFAGAPLPLLGTTPAAWADSHIICLRNDLEGKRLEVAWRFSKYLSDNSLEWVEGGQVPVRQSLRNTPRFQNMKIQQEFSKQLPYIRYIPRIPFTFEWSMEMSVAAEKVLKGRLGAKEALEEATENVNKTIRRRNQMLVEHQKRIK